LKAIQLQQQRDADSKARIDAEIAEKQDMLRRRQEEASKLADADSSAQDLVKRVQELRHKVEMRVGPSGAHVRSAPFEAAATLETLKQSTDVWCSFSRHTGLVLKPMMDTAAGSGKKNWCPCLESNASNKYKANTLYLVFWSLTAVGIFYSRRKRSIERTFTEPRADVERAVSAAKSNSSGNFQHSKVL